MNTMSNEADRIPGQKPMSDELRDPRSRALEKLYPHIERRVRTRVFVTSAVTAEDIDEIINDVGLEVFNNAAKISTPGTLERVIANAIKHIVDDRSKKAHAQKRDVDLKAVFVEDTKDGDTAVVCAAKIDMDIMASQAFEENKNRDQKIQAIREVVATLEVSDQQLYRLNYSLGLTAAQVGERIGKSEGAVEQDLLNLRAKIKALVQQ